MKRLAAPAFWPVEKKTKKFVVRLAPGPHSKEESMPLGLVLRDVLKYARTSREAGEILKAGHVRVDGVLRKEKRFPVGVMDVLTVGNEVYRVLPDKKGLYMRKIPKAEAVTKLLKVTDKRTIKKAKTQLNFHDGTNALSDAEISTKDVVVFDTVGRTIKSVIKFDKGSTALITGGRNRGGVGRIEKIIIVKSSKPNYVVVDMGDRKIAIPEDYIFVVGTGEPAIKLNERQTDAGGAG